MNCGLSIIGRGIKNCPESVAAEENSGISDKFDKVLRNLTDKEIESAIRGCDSQAYYQEFEVTQ